jgi:ribosomal protein L11 methyltransferase
MTASGPPAPATWTVTWTVTVTVPDAALAAVEAALAPCCEAVASFEAAGGGWRVTGYAAAEPDRAALGRRLALAAAAAGCALPAPALARLPATDWLAENRRSFRSVAAGRYRVVPRDDGDGGRESAGGGAIVIRLNAGPAFGSGSHESTRGCLVALDRLARRRVPRRILDLGTGSGILAIAAARTWPAPAPVIATDIDPVAAATARDNARANGVGARVDARAGPGFRPVARDGRFDLVVANIQARPLVGLARAMQRHTRHGSEVILSGLLTRHAPAVLAAYRSRGFVLADRVRLGDWTTLTLRRGRRRF